MRTAVLLLGTLAALFHTACAYHNPSPEQMSRDAAAEADAERRQAEFRKGLPPVDEPRR